jgi:uncharacterized membrane protein HdeD (DUF308 family)
VLVTAPVSVAWRRAGSRHACGRQFVVGDDGDSTNALLFGIVSLAFGVLILLVPRVLNYLVAFYLIVVGIVFIVRACRTSEELST